MLATDKWIVGLFLSAVAWCLAFDVACGGGGYDSVDAADVAPEFDASDIDGERGLDVAGVDACEPTCRLSGDGSCCLCADGFGRDACCAAFAPTATFWHECCGRPCP